MEENIKKVEKTLSRCYMLFWIIPILIAAAGEFNLIPNGTYADNFSTTYYYEVIGILLTAAFIPLALKLFQWTLVKHIDKLSFPVALKKYGTICIIRLGLLAFVVIFNLIAYYLIMSTTCILCACIGLTASLFCIPSDRRLREELQITKDNK